jgi:FkbM family methyltransferase
MTFLKRIAGLIRYIFLGRYSPKPKLKDEVIFEGVILNLNDPAISENMKRQLNFAYETAEVQLAKKHLNSSDKVLEIGGGIGFMGIFLKKIIGVLDYIAVEPNYQLNAVSKKNQKLNGVDFETLNFVLGNENGDLQFNFSDDFWSSSLLPRNDTKKTERINAVTVETLLSKLSFDPNTVLIDIEGYEKDLDFNALTKKINKIIIELHPHIIESTKCARIITQIMMSGYELIDYTDNVFYFSNENH